MTTNLTGLSSLDFDEAWRAMHTACDTPHRYRITHLPSGRTSVERFKESQVIAGAPDTDPRRPSLRSLYALTEAWDRAGGDTWRYELVLGVSDTWPLGYRATLVDTGRSRLCRFQERDVDSGRYLTSRELSMPLALQWKLDDWNRGTNGVWRYELTNLARPAAADICYPMPGLVMLSKAALTEARTFALSKWRERARERGEPEPEDLTNACKFCSLFVQVLFGGTLRGNHDHQFNWIEGQRFDLTDGAEGLKDLKDCYRHDEEFFFNPEHLESLASCQDRVADWVAEFMRTHAHLPLHPLPW